MPKIISKLPAGAKLLDHPVRLLVVATVIFVIALAASWWQFVYSTPEAVFNAAIENSLTTNGVIKKVSQSDQQNKVDQSTYLSFTNGAKSQSVTVLEQASPLGGSSRVVTENIGAADADYIRYRSIDVAMSGQPTDVSNIENIWAKRENGQKAANQSSFLDEGVFGIVPFANLSEPEAQVLAGFAQSQNVYNFTSHERKFENGRPVYVYQVQFLPEALVGYLAQYADKAGVGDKAQLNPSNYKDVPPVKVEFKIDVVSRQLISIEFKDTGRVELYQGHGLTREIEIPSDTIPITELQKRLQNVR